jgi:hypothetical protein
VLFVYKQERAGEVQIEKSRVRADIETLIRAIPAGWRVAVVKYGWASRAEAFDHEQFCQEDEDRRRRLALLEKIEADREKFQLPSKKRRSEEERYQAMMAKADRMIANYAKEEEKLRAQMRRMMKRTSKGTSPSSKIGHELLQKTPVSESIKEVKA